MTKYKCGHESNYVITSLTPDVNAHYNVWRTTTGFDGDKSECFECYCKRIRNEKFNETFKREAQKLEKENTEAGHVNLFRIGRE